MHSKIFSTSATTFFSGFALFISLLLTLASCEEPSYLGLEVLPDDDSFSIHKYSLEDIETSIWKRDSIVGLDNPASLLGEMNDPVFGGLTASFMTQVGIPSFGHDFGTDPVADSLVLYLLVTDFYGDEGTPQEIVVYQLNELISRDKHIYSNFDPMTMDPEPELVTRQIIHPEEGDSIFSIHITSNELKDKLLLAPDSTKQSISQFINYFNGLYVTAETPSGERGFVSTINLNSDISRLTMYYRNDNNPDNVLQYNYIVTESATRVNLFEHDYERAIFYDALGQSETDDSVFYIQGGHGLMSLMDFKHLDIWRDSMIIEPFSLNSARLFLPVDTIAQNTDYYPLPERLFVLDKNEEGELVITNDLRLGDPYFRGDFNSETGEYMINITNWVNSYLTGEQERNYLYLDVRGAGNYPHFGIFRNMNHPKGGLRLELTYTRL